MSSRYLDSLRVITDAIERSKLIPSSVVSAQRDALAGVERLEGLLNALTNALINDADYRHIASLVDAARKELDE